MHPRPLSLQITGQDGPAVGWYHPPAEPRRALGVVLCPPLGAEVMCAYRALRIFAERLAAAGIAVVRVDYHGTGDSAGDDLTPGRVGAWLASIDAAVAALRERAGEVAVSLVGVRMGALLAGVAASRRDDIDSVVLWGALRSGKAYVREQRVLRISEAKNAGIEAVFDGAGATEEAAGFALSGETIAALGDLDLTILGRRPAPRVLCIGRDEMAPDTKVITALEKLGATVTSVSWPGLASMLLAPHDSIPPLALFDSSIAWLNEQSAAASIDAPAPPAEECTRTWGTGKTSVHEEVIRFGEDGRLVGIVTHPVGRAPRSAPTIVLTNTGANYHVGPNRMYVTMARRWAALGFRVLRMDVSTIGESEALVRGTHNRLYTTSNVPDIGQGAAELRKRWGEARIVLIGLCSGAYVAFQASLARAIPVAAQVLINPMTFYWKEEAVPRDLSPGVVYNRTQYLRRALFRVESWKKALSGRIQYRKTAQLLVTRLRILATDVVNNAKRRAGLVSKEDVGMDLVKISDAGTHTLIVFSAADPGADYLERNAGDHLSRLGRRTNFRVETVEGADHTFTPLDAQSDLYRVITSFFEQRWPA